MGELHEIESAFAETILLRNNVMARRTKEQKRQDDFINMTCQNSLLGYQCDIMKLSKLSGAGEAVAKAGGTDAEIEAAILAARDEHAVKAA